MPNEHAETLHRWKKLAELQSIKARRENLKHWGSSDPIISSQRVEHQSARK